MIESENTPYTPSNKVVPYPPSCVPTNATKLNPRRHLAWDTDDIDIVELDPKKLQQREDLGPSLFELRDVDPSLVFLCYRGFNHIFGKLQTGKAMMAKVPD